MDNRGVSPDNSRSHVGNVDDANCKLLILANVLHGYLKLKITVLKINQQILACNHRYILKIYISLHETILIFYA